MIVPGKQIRWRDFFKEVYRGWKDDALADTAAALTYYGVLAAFPFLIFAVTVAGLLLDQRAILQIVTEAGRIVPGPVAQILGERLTSLQQNAHGGLLTFGILAALWAASGGVSSLGQALNRCYDVRETRPFWRSRGNAVLVTLVASVAGVLAAGTMFFVPALGRWIGGPFGAALGWLRFPVAGLILVALWAFLYWALPNVRPKFQLVTPGSIVGAIVWLATSWGFSEYARHWGRYDAVYGTLGGVIVLLVWMWLSSVVILLGAEINKVLTPADKLKYESPTGEQAAGGREPRTVARPRGAPPEPSPAT